MYSSRFFQVFFLAFGMVVLEGCTRPIGDAIKASSASFSSQCPAFKSTGISTPYVIYNGDQRAFIEQTPYANFAQSIIGLVPNVWLDPDNRITRTFTVGRTQNLCPEEPYRDMQLVASCTGVLIGSDIVLTAGHCVPTPASCKDKKYIFNMSGANLNRSAYAPSESEVFSCQSLLFSLENDFTDLALVKLDRPALGRRQFSINLETQLSFDTPLINIGHPESLPMMVSPEGSYKGNTGGYFLHDLDVFGGSSGSPVFAGDQVIGVHSRRLSTLPHYEEDSLRSCQTRAKYEPTQTQNSRPTERDFPEAADTRVLINLLRDDIEVLSGRILKVIDSGPNMVIEGFACGLARPEALEIKAFSTEGQRINHGTFSAGLNITQEDERHCQSGSSHEFRIEVPLQAEVELVVAGTVPENSMSMRASLNPRQDCF